jgi:UDP-N-acetylmuramoyl-tripeptide--D-alanyl-D-alanine ligase
MLSQDGGFTPVAGMCAIINEDSLNTPSYKVWIRIAVLGDMLELGSHSRRLHADLAAPLAASNVDLVLLAGEEMRALAENPPADRELHHHDSLERLQAALLKILEPGDAVMIKSSNGIGFSKLVEAVLKKYPETAAVSQIKATT